MAEINMENYPQFVSRMVRVSLIEQLMVYKLNIIPDFGVLLCFSNLFWPIFLAWMAVGIFEGF